MPRVRAATSETARDINRRIVLNLIRDRQPISRADLARVSGLQRSTVSLIVEELLESGWVEEWATGRLPRGRRPTYIRLNESRLTIGVDIRPMETTVAIADVNGQIKSQEVFATALTPAGTVNEVAARIRKLRRASHGSTIEGVGVSISGRIDPITHKIVFAPNLKWHDADVAGPLRKATGLEVEVENAANACALAHVWFSGEKLQNLIAITVSEGVGAGLYFNGQLVRGAGGLAGEFGHMTLDPEGPVCGCGKRGCWEVYASNLAAIRAYRPSKDQTTFGEILMLAEKGDREARSVVERMATYLGRGAAMLATGLAPEAIVFVGEFTRSWHRMGPVIGNEIARGCPTPHRVRLVAAGEGSTARLRGTFALVFQKHFGLTSVLGAAIA